ncbi:MAG TPA: type II secretion system inner membrane protein GspF [bacterium]|nr:type II secretion system inner membrane protein GspF [bacterium]
MPVYEYKALNASGKTETGIVDADSAKAARAKLRKTGIFPTELVEEASGPGAKPKLVKKSASVEVDFKKLFGGGVSTQDLAIMTRQLATLLGAGISMIEALNALTEQVENERLKVAISSIKEKVNEGSGLAQAMRAYPKIFSDLYCNMIAAGEASGALDVVLKRLADFQEAQVALNNRLVAAMVYPAIMALVGLGVVGFLMGFVVPKVTKIFTDMKVALPLVTRMLIAISHFFTSFWWLLLILVVGGAWFFRRWRATEAGKAQWDAFTLRAPVFGKLLRLVAVARFSRTLATLLSSGVSLIQSLTIVKAIVANTVIQAAIEDTRVAVQEGESIAEPLKRSRQFPPIMTHMIAIGEKTGELETMLEKVADAYEVEVKTRIDMMTALLEPAMTLTMGLLVAFIALSILLPMLKMNALVSHH